MKLLAILLGKLLDPLLKMVFGQRFSLAELLISNAQARKAGRQEAADEGLRQTHEALERAQAARRAVDHTADGILRDPDNRD